VEASLSVQLCTSHCDPFAKLPFQTKKGIQRRQIIEGKSSINSPLPVGSPFGRKPLQSPCSNVDVTKPRPLLAIASKTSQSEKKKKKKKERATLKLEFPSFG
jgi:hypothetical protein